MLSKSSTRLVTALAVLTLVFLGYHYFPREGIEGAHLFFLQPEEGLSQGFEVRFNQPVVQEKWIAVENGPAPLQFKPELPGSWTWISLRSCRFIPQAFPGYHRSYFVQRHPQVKDVTLPAEVKIRKTLVTPAFSFRSIQDRGYGVAENGLAPMPSIRLKFNGFVDASRAEDYLSIENARHERIAVEVLNQELSADYLYIRPRKALQEGEWFVYLRPGLPSSVPQEGLRKSVRVPLGQVKPFQFLWSDSQNLLNSGKTLLLQFNKTLSPLLNSTSLVSFVSLSPAVSNEMIYLRGNQIAITGDFATGQDYRVLVGAGLPSYEGFSLLAPTQTVVRFKPLPPRVYLSGFSSHHLAAGLREYPIKVANASSMEVTLRAVSPENMVHVLRGYERYFREPRPGEDPKARYHEVDEELVPARVVFKTNIGVSGPDKEVKEMKLNLDQFAPGGKLANGLYLLSARLPGPNQTENEARTGAQALIQLSDLGMSWKQSDSEMWVYVFSHKTGEPVPHARVQLLTNDSEPIHEAVTEAGGWARLALGATPGGKEFRWLIARTDQDAHALDLQAETSITPHNLSRWRGEEAERTDKMMLFSDRTAYRQNETIHLSGLARFRENGQLVVPTGAAKLELYDGRHRLFLTTNLTFTPHGSIAGSFSLATASRGTCRAVVHWQSNTVDHVFQIQDFKADAFQVQVKTPPVYLPGENQSASIHGRYFFGKPLSQAEVRWSATWSPHFFRPPGYEGYSFTLDHLEGVDSTRQQPVFLEGQGTLNADGILALPLTTGTNTFMGAWQVHIQAEVTDMNQQTISGSATSLQHPSLFYLGIKDTNGVLVAGETNWFPVAAVAAAGGPWTQPTSAQVRIDEIIYHTVRIQSTTGAIHYRHRMETNNVLERTIQIGEGAGPYLLPVLLAKAGPYTLTISSRDPQGHPVVVRKNLYVYGDAKAHWNLQSSMRLDLVPQQTNYFAGQTARLLVKSPFAGKAWICVEREKVLRTWGVTLNGTASAIEIPLEAKDAPNIFVSVLLVRGSQDSPHQFKMPEFRIGYIELPVARPEANLKVTLAHGHDFEPGQKIEVVAHVQDFQGRPAAETEVTLYAVDEGVLNLTGYDNPDPIQFFNSPHPLKVRTCLSLPQLFSENPEEQTFYNKGFLVGDGGSVGGKSESRPRRQFPPCVFWKSGLLTDAEGRIKVSFDAPDQITRYRLVAVAANRQNQFGAAEGGFKIHKSIMIESSLPPVGRKGDEWLARAILFNQTDQIGEAKVRLVLDGMALAREGLEKTISLRPGEQIPVEFPIQWTKVGASRWLWEVEMKGTDPSRPFRDAVEGFVQVEPRVASLRHSQNLQIQGSHTNLLGFIHPDWLDGDIRAEISVSTTRLGLIAEALSYLIKYPYGCVEQTTSSTIPWIFLRQTQLDLPGVSPEKIDQAIRAGTDRLLSMQTESGALSYWPGQQQPMTWGSAYGCLGLTLARRAGVEIPEESYQSLLRYLSQSLRNDRLYSGDACLVLYVLSLAGKAEPAYLEKWYQQRAVLPAEDCSLLALAIAENKGSPSMILDLLGQSAKVASHQSFYSLGREKALRLLILLAQDKDPEAVGRAVDELFKEQKNGHWQTTQGNAWGLLALAQYSRQNETRQEVSLELRSGDKVDEVRLDSARYQAIRTFQLEGRTPVVSLIRSEQSPLFVQVNVQVFSAKDQVQEVKQGFTIQRTYQKIAPDGQLTAGDHWQVGDSVLVTLLLDNPMPRAYVAIDDPLPSLWEGVLPEFKSRQILNQPKTSPEFSNWYSNHQEIRHDRVLFFRDALPKGNYQLQYVARVRAAGKTIAPPVRVEAMYDPNFFGLSKSSTVEAKP